MEKADKEDQEEKEEEDEEAAAIRPGRLGPVLRHAGGAFGIP